MARIKSPTLAGRAKIKEQGLRTRDDVHHLEHCIHKDRCAQDDKGKGISISIFGKSKLMIHIEANGRRQQRGNEQPAKDRKTEKSFCRMCSFFSG